LAELQPEVITAYPSVLNRLAGRLDKKDGAAGVAVNPRFMMTGAEVLTPHHRSRITEAFGAPVYDVYSSCEFHIVGWECKRTGELHTSDDSTVVEVVAGGRQVAPGEEGEVVGTALHSYAMPIIRYRMGDVGILSEGTCSCGRGLPVLKEVSGRMLDSVQTPDGKKVHGMYFEYLPKYFIGEIRQFQIVQEDLRRITVRIVREPGFNESTLVRFEDEIRKVVGRSVVVEFVVEVEIPREATGKNRLVVSRIGSEA